MLHILTQSKIKSNKKIFKNMKKAGKTIICVTHDQEVANAADRVINLVKQ